MTYLLCHGFGFDNSYWENLTPLLDEDYEFFNKDFKASFETSYIGIGHSLGFLKLNNSGIAFRALVGLQGFLNFCGSEPTHRKFLQKNLERISEKCEKDSARFLEFFRNLCGDKRKSDFQNHHKEDLLGDLKLMQNSYTHCNAPTLIIGSHQDKIVENVILEDNFGNRKSVRLKYIDGVNHTLGLDKPRETFELIKDFLREVSQC